MQSKRPTEASQDDIDVTEHLLDEILAGDKDLMETPMMREHIRRIQEEVDQGTPEGGQGSAVATHEGLWKGDDFESEDEWEEDDEEWNEEWYEDWDEEDEGGWD